MDESLQRKGRPAGRASSKDVRLAPDSLDGLSGDREERIRRLFRDVLLPLREDYYHGRISEAEFKGYEETVMSNLTELCEPEIVEAVQENFIGCVLCAVGCVVEDDEVVGISYPDIIASAGVRRAVDIITKVGGNRTLHEHVKACTAEVFAERQAEAREQWRKLAPEEILPHITRWSRPSAAVLLGHLTFEQRNGLLALLFARTEKKSLYMWLGDEPEDELLWRMWYTGALQALHLATRSEKDNRPVIILLGEGWGKPPPKGVNSARPMHATFFRQLVKERRKSGHVIRDPDSVARIARLTDKSRSTIDYYLASGVQVEVSLDDKGNVRAQFRTKDIWDSVQIARRRKRGRKPKGS
jgi:hypothetical protein